MGVCMHSYNLSRTHPGASLCQQVSTNPANQERGCREGRLERCPSTTARAFIFPPVLYFQQRGVAA